MFITAMGSDSNRTPMFRRGLAMVLMAVILVTSAFSVAALSKTAVVYADGEEIKITTLSTDIDEILNLAEVEVGPYDLVTDTEKDGELYINVKRAFTVTLNVLGEEKQYKFAKGTVKDVLAKANIKTNDNVIVTPEEGTALTANMEINVSYFKSIVLNDAGKKKEVKVPAGTVKQALNYLKITLGSKDELNVKLTDEVTDDMELVITRISYKDVTTKEDVKFATKTTYTTDLAPNETQVVTEGVKGEKTVVTTQKIVNGKVTKTKVIKEKITKEPVDKEVLKGEEVVEASAEETQSTNSGSSNTQASYKNTTQAGGAGVPVSSQNGVLYDENGNEVSYSAVHHGSGTAYYAPADSLTASGATVHVGGVAVNPNIIPYGSKLYIVADDGFVYGYATAIDTGGALMSGEAIVDVFYYTYDECVVFGRRDVSVYVLS